MKRSAERTIMFYDMKVENICPKFSGLIKYDAKDVLSILYDVVSDNKIIYSNENKTLSYYVSDFSRDRKNGLSLLFNKSDKTLADPSFSNPHKGKRRTVNKRDGEGHDQSSHVYILPNPGKEFSAICLVEQSIGMSAARIQWIINKSINEYKKYNKPLFVANHPDGSLDENGSPRKIACWPKIKLEGHISDEFEDDLRKGEILGVEVITDEKSIQNFDSKQYSTAKKKVLKLKLASNIKDDPLTVFKEITKSAKNKKIDKAKVAFKDPNGKNRSATVDTDSFNFARECSYIKKKVISGFNSVLPDSHDEIDNQILSKMKRLI